MRFRCVMLLVLSGFVGCGRDPVAALDTPEQLTLYSIDGRDFEPGEEPKAEEKFYRYPVLGKVQTRDAVQRHEIVAALEEGVARRDSKMKAGCFWPRHAIRAVETGRTIDFVICFECYQLEVHEGSHRTSKPVTRDPQPVFNKYLHEAKIPLAPSPVGESK